VAHLQMGGVGGKHADTHTFSLTPIEIRV